MFYLLAIWYVKPCVIESPLYGPFKSEAEHLFKCLEAVGKFFFL